MIIKKITIENFLCYYRIKEFELSDGLNIILGENGEGKTKFFEALEWLFNGDNRNLRVLVSAKAIAEAEVNEEFRVRVGITVEQYEVIKTVSKSFIVKKLKGDALSTINYSIEGVEETKTGERIQVDGNSLLEKVFPSRIRRYSMFKGESQLDIFKNEDALMNLIDSFSSAKYYEKYTEKGEYLREKAEKAVDDATRSDSNNQKEYRRLEAEIAELSKKKREITVFINSSEEQIKKTEESIQEAEKYVINAEALQTINERINNIDKQIIAMANSIDENYTTALFDERWILVNFEKIHHEFSKKVSAIASKKRELQSEFDKQIGIKEGKKLMEAQLLNNSIPLPKGVPSKAHMEEMLKDEFCKVCNREARKGSEAYSFMQKRLKDYLKSQIPEQPENDKDKILFRHDYVSLLFNMGVSHEDNLAELRGVKKVIKELFELHKRKKEDLEGLKQKREKEIVEREKVIGNSRVGAEKLGNVLKNYNGWHTDLTNRNKELSDYKNKLKNIEGELIQRKVEKDGIDIKSANTFLIKTREVLRDIEEIFTSIKKKKLEEFVDKLQKKSNTHAVAIVKKDSGITFHDPWNNQIHVSLTKAVI